MEHNNRRYFKSLEELSNPSLATTKEFLPGTPGKEILDEGDFDLKSNRRDFLKFMGFGISAATLAACTKAPVKKAIPYVIKPVDIDPGISNYYASFYADGGYGVVVKTREGRPIKIEGNDLDPLSKGATTTAGQASILSLYDEGRLSGPIKGQEPISWQDLDKEVYIALKKVAASGKRTVILSESVHSPSTLRAIQVFVNAQANASHVQYDAISYGALRDAYKGLIGIPAIPYHDFSKAKTIVSFGADFLGTWLMPLAFTKQYSSVRDVTQGQQMAYHVQFESLLSLTGSKADLRVPCKPSEQGATLVALYNALASETGAAPLSNPGAFNPYITEEKINHVAKELLASMGKSIVVCGANDFGQQAICAKINQLLGNLGQTILTDKAVNLYNGSDAAMNDLVAQMNAGEIGALILYGANPSYNHPMASAFNSGLEKVDVSISLSDRLDETSKRVGYVAPDHHWLESWNDYNPVAGQYNLSQPTISNIFNTRQAQESILTWGKVVDANYYDFMRETWMSSSGMSGTTFEKFWTQSLHDGMYLVGAATTLTSVAQIQETATARHASTDHTAIAENDVVLQQLEEITLVDREKVGVLEAAKEVAKGDNTLKGAVKDVLHGRTTTETVVTAGAVVTSAAATPTTGKSTVFDFKVGAAAPSTADTLRAPSMDLGSLASNLIAGKNQSSGAELLLYQKTGLMDGKFANNPWLLELPDSITKVSWDNYLCVSPVEALEKGWADGDLVTVTVGEVSVANVPLLLQPGQLSGTYSLALGYGHDMDAQAGRVANGVGQNAYPLVAGEAYRKYEAGGVSITKTGSGYALAKTQTHHHIQIPTGLGKKDRPSTARRKADIVKETSLGTLVAFRQQQQGNGHAAEGNDTHGHEAPAPTKVYGDAGDPPGKFKDLNLYPDWRDTANFYKAIHWGMTVNLNTCTGCNACVIACQAENNIPVVGKDEVMRRRELHWMRIDRYFATPDKKEEDRDLLYTDNPSVMFQPLMCQHCDNAPCENVCPVNAINHSSEGINQQVYNRCMGTRYCANNCPYKVRRFNWFAYFDNEKYNYNFTMNSGLGRMVLNPDVTVRARGVMEKCSFCTQRIQAAKLVAKTENRALKDGDVKVACQQTCPADAIQFGNMNDPHSKVSEVIKGDLSYRLVELLNTDNSVYYTTQVRNVKLESELELWNSPVEEGHHGA